jgi:hypothetical protein
LLEAAFAFGGSLKTWKRKRNVGGEALADAKASTFELDC